MRFMVMIKADKNSEAGELPDEKLLTEMGKYNEELAKAGVLLAGEGLQPSSKGARVRFSGDKRTVIDGPFSETKELIAGFWLFQVKSKEEAIEWVKRCPNPLKGESEIEIRQVFEASDFGPALTPELREAEERLRSQLSANENDRSSLVSSNGDPRSGAEKTRFRRFRGHTFIYLAGGGFVAERRASSAFLLASLIAPSRGFAATRHQ